MIVQFYHPDIGDIRLNEDSQMLMIDSNVLFPEINVNSVGKTSYVFPYKNNKYKITSYQNEYKLIMMTWTRLRTYVVPTNSENDIIINLEYKY